MAFLDETGFLLVPTIAKTWAPRGKTPVLLSQHAGFIRQSITPTTQNETHHVPAQGTGVEVGLIPMKYRGLVAVTAFADQG